MGFETLTHRHHLESVAPLQKRLPVLAVLFRDPEELQEEGDLETLTRVVDTS